MPTVAADRLLEFAAELLAAGGVGREEAGLIARSLVDSNLRGHDSHGMMRIPYYLDGLNKGETTAAAEITPLRETDSILVADGNWGFGQTVMHQLTGRLIEKARTCGVAVGTLLHSCHIGRLGEYCERVARDGNMLSMVMVNTHGSTRRVAPPGGTAPRLGTNPLAFGMPTDTEPLILDFGTSATAEGKVRVKRIAGQQCPDNWLLDSDGNPTNDPHTLYGDPPGTIRPMGGDHPYKGFGLGLVVEIFSGALSGGICAREVPINQLGNCVFILVIDPEHMAGGAHYAQQVKSLIEFVRGCPTVAGVDEILLPGDPERNTMAARRATGVPFDEGNWRQIVELAQQLGVKPPPSN